MKENNTEVISPSMCYAYAAIAEGAPFIMGAPNLCVDTPAMWEFSKKMNVPISGKDFKSGQTLMKTVLAPMFKTRMLGVSGWFSTIFWVTVTARYSTNRRTSSKRGQQAVCYRQYLRAGEIS